MAQPDQLRAAVLEADGAGGGQGENRIAPSVLWSIALPQRLSSPAAEDGTWLADEDVTCVAQVELDDRSPGRGRINIFHRGGGDATKRGESVDALLHRAIEIVERAGGASKTDPGVGTILTFAALDREALLPRVKSVLASRGFTDAFVSECSLWTYDGPDYDVSIGDLRLPGGVSIRRLGEEDAELVNERWAYKRDDGSSLRMIREMIAASRESTGGCAGLYLGDGRLVSWACRYPDDTVGMVHTEEDCRRRGYAEAVVKHAANDMRSERGRDERTVISYIVDSNAASQGLYRRLGWRRMGGADWAGFISQKT